MKRLISICFLITAIVATVSITTGQRRGGQGAAPAATNADWPTFGGDNTRTNANMGIVNIWRLP